ncbi:putative late blight resistance protein homolog R1B-17 [Olea europaea var. sylvestris]|uniref:putative late blight resistance protein homolog R1B-17 n=1 Tax=Olea europaea var. sylvestris TaxID=158386 RepID=UPI000C1D846A|nr:putative late blight resistance protein homolog R1B-17 [Olea europaea var. sylvestris]
MNFVQESFHERKIKHQTFCENFVIVADEIDSIKTKAAKLKEFWGTTDLHQSQRTSFPTGQSRLPSIGKNDMVGFHNDLNQIIDRLTGNQGALQLIPVTGMGGIGKTTLGKNVYNDPRIKDHFHTRAWVSISQEYREREVLLNLLDSMEQLSAEMCQENSTAKLKDYLHKSLIGMTYLVVLDDIWTTEARGSLRRIFPDERNGSRIMLTTRLLCVVDSRHSPHRMQFLNETDSWNLLCQKVFGEDFCPLELEEVGKEISNNCKGLPLSLVVIGNHLSKVNRTKDHWEYVAENVKSVVNAADENCSEILSLSYDYLPHYFKARFLYMGVLPEDDEIRVSKLIKLWAAEGFLKPVRGKTLEEVAEEFLGDLISRNLILISKKSSSGKIKTCSIHDMLRDLCVRKAQEDKFFHVTVTNKDFKIYAEGIKYSRRLCIHPDIFQKELSNSDNSNVNTSVGSLPPIRSTLCSHLAGEIYESGNRNLFPLLRVLDLGKGKVDGFPIKNKISSRKVPFFLRTLIVDCEDVHLPEEIWRMPQLRHLLFGMCYLPCPARSPIDGDNLILENLLTLSKVSSVSCTKEVFERVPNLKKLGIFSEQWITSPLSLGTLVNLPQLENLRIRNVFSTLMNFTFPPNIKKLTLDGCRIPWKHMTIVGSMPNLEVLKLRYHAFYGPEWEPGEGEFCKLKFLLLHSMRLKQWRADKTHFPSLVRLILRACLELEEIRCSIGDISTLQIIDLDDASPSAVTSAKKIQEEQRNLGNDSLQVRFSNFFHFMFLKRKEAEAEICGSTDDTLLLKATKQFHTNLYRDPVEEVASAVVPRLFEFLKRDDYPQLQCEAALAITGISNSSSDMINTLIDHGSVPIMVSLLSSPKDVLRGQASDEHYYSTHRIIQYVDKMSTELVVTQRRNAHWKTPLIISQSLSALHVLGKFAVDSTKSRDIVLSYGVLMPLLAQFNDETKLYITRKAMWTFSLLCAGKPKPQFEQVYLLIAFLFSFDAYQYC